MACISCLRPLYSALVVQAQLAAFPALAEAKFTINLPTSPNISALHTLPVSSHIHYYQHQVFHITHDD